MHRHAQQRNHRWKIGYWFPVRQDKIKGWAFSVYLEQILPDEVNTDSTQRTKANLTVSDSNASVRITGPEVGHSCSVPVMHGAPVIIKISDQDDFVAISPGTDVLRALIFVDTRTCKETKVDAMVELDPGIWKNGSFFFRKLRDTGNYCYELNAAIFSSGMIKLTEERAKYPKGSQGCG